LYEQHPQDITLECEVERVPEKGMSRNSVQAHQFLREITSAVPTFVLRVQGQRGNKVAADIKESISTTTRHP